MDKFKAFLLEMIPMKTARALLVLTAILSLAVATSTIAQELQLAGGQPHKELTKADLKQLDSKEPAPAADEALQAIEIDAARLNPKGVQYPSPVTTPGAQQFVNEVEPNGTPATATPLGSTNAVAYGNVYVLTATNGDLDFFSVTANAGDRIYAATQTSFAVSTDSVLDVIDSDGVTVIENDDNDGAFGASSSTIAGATVPAGASPRTIYIRVRGSGTLPGTTKVNPYALHVRVQSGAPAAEVEPNDAVAQVLPASGWISGIRGSATDLDFYALSLNAGDTVYVSADWNPERDGTTWDGQIFFGPFGDAGNFVLGSNDTSATSPNSDASFWTVKSAGVYNVLVTGSVAFAANQTYHLSVSVHPASPACTTYSASVGAGTPIVDAGTTDIPIIVPAGHRIADLNAAITLTHASMPDLDVTLISPAGNEVSLFTDTGATTQTQMDIGVDDEAGIPNIGFAQTKGMVWQPESAGYRLAWFKGEEAGGTWTLRIRDDLAPNTGTLTAASLTICDVPPACGVGNVPVATYSENFDGGGGSDGGYTHSGAQDEWQRGLPAAGSAPITTCNSGSNCWKTDLAAGYNASSNETLSSPSIPVTMPPGTFGPVMLNWAQKYQMESSSFDSFFAEVRQAGLPATAVQLFQHRDRTMTDSVGTAATTINESAGWGIVSANISSFLGQNVEVRWNLNSDTSVQFSGLAVDDVSITVCTCTPASCDDHLDCTLDTCVPGVGCQHSPVTDGTSCIDYPTCGTGGTCSAGVCTGSTPANCNDSNVCTTDSCNTSTGLCDHVAIVCNDNNPCTDDACVSPSTGCVFTPNNGNSCTDGNGCTSDACVGGTCQSTVSVFCNDSNSCTDDACNPATGLCVYTNNDANACSDGNDCTIDACTSGVCGCPPITGVSQVYTSTDVPKAISATGTPTITSTLTVSGANPYLAAVNLKTFITHALSSELSVTLMSPAGTVVTITSRNGSTNTYNGTTWSDKADPGNQVPFPADTFAASNLVVNTVYTASVVKTSLVPEEALGAFLGENPNGVWTLTVNDAVTGNGGSLDNWSLDLRTLQFAPSVQGPTIASSSTPGTINDNATLTQSVVVSGATGTVGILKLNTTITHTFPGDLDITLTSPSGTVVTITDDNALSNDNVFNGTAWFSKADPDSQVPYAGNPNIVTDHTYTLGTTATPLTAQEALSAFNGESPNGTWTLRVFDDANLDTGTLSAWSIEVTTLVPNPLSCVLPSGSACGSPADTACDNPDTCNATGTCLPNNEPNGSACGSPADTECDNPDSCLGGSCQSNFEPAGHVCGSAADTNCDNPDSCNGTGTCLTNNEPNGTACSDGAACTSPDSCTSGVCSGPVTCRNVSVPSVSDICANTDIVIPITVDSAIGVLAMDFTLTYNPAVVNAVAVYPTAFASSFTLTSNLSTPGVVRISLFGTSALNGSGQVAWILFHAVGPNGSSTALTFTQHDLNEGALASTAFNGVINIGPASVTISMPDTANGAPGTNVAVPIHAAPVAGLHSFDITVQYDPAVINALSVSTTAATAGWTLTPNLTVPGQVSLSLFNVTPLAGAGADIATILFHVAGANGSSSPLHISYGITDDGVSTCLDDGLFTVCADADGDGYTVCGGDCNDNDATIHPGVPDTDCDNVDDNCSGTADEGYVPTGTTCGTAPCASTGLLVCLPGGILSDTCNPSSTNGNSCTSDGNDCTNDVCLAGVCSHPNTSAGTPCGSPADTNCDNPDTCNGLGSCQANNEPNGTSCSDGDPCTTADQCVGGICGHIQTTWNVPGDSSNTCTTVNPSCSTISGAIAASITGDTIIVASGLYPENLTLAKGLTIRGAQVGVNGCSRSGAESTISGSGTGNRVQLQTCSAGSVIDGFTITGGARAIESISGRIDRVRILNNVITNWTGSGIFLNDNGNNIDVSDNKVDAVLKVGTGDSVHLDTDDFDGFRATNNCIVYSGASAFAVGTGFFVDGNHNVGPSIGAGARTPQFNGNLVTKHGTGANMGRFAFEFGTVSGNKFTNNDFDGLQGGIQNSSIDHNTFNHNGRSGLALTGFGGAGDATRGAKNDTITENCITNNGVARIAEGLFFTSGQFPGTISTNVAHLNFIGGNYRGANYPAPGPETINAENNYWNSPSGPNSPPQNPGGTGDQVDTPNGSGGLIDLIPFNTSSALSCPCTPGSCDDANACTTDACDVSTGLCSHTPVNCDDSNVCTSDSCNPGTGCAYSPICTIAGHIYYNKVTPTGPNPPNPGTDGPDITKPIPAETVKRTSNLSPTAFAVTDASGLYQFLNDAGGNVTLTPQPLLGEEAECQATITAADASRISQSTVFLTFLTPNEKVAGDVSANGTVSSFDASLVAQKAVATTCTSYLTPVEVLTGSAWAWLPASRNYNPLTGLQNYDFIGMLYGDVTDSWSDLPPLMSAGAPGVRPPSADHFATVTAQAAGGAKTVLYLAQAPRQRQDGLYDVVLGLQNSDGILGLDMKLRYNASDIAIRGVSTTGIASSFNLSSNDLGGEYALSFFSANAMQGTGQFLVVTIDIKHALSGDPFQVSAEANEGQIPVSIGTPGGPRSHDMTGDE